MKPSPNFADMGFESAHWRHPFWGGGPHQMGCAFWKVDLQQGVDSHHHGKCLCDSRSTGTTWTELQGLEADWGKGTTSCNCCCLSVRARGPGKRGHVSCGLAHQWRWRTVRAFYFRIWAEIDWEFVFFWVFGTENRLRHWTHPPFIDDFALRHDGYFTLFHKVGPPEGNCWNDVHVAKLAPSNLTRYAKILKATTTGASTFWFRKKIMIN